MSYVVVNIGCIECCVTSDIVGNFKSFLDAELHANKLNENEDAKWREGGQNSYEVFELPEENKVNSQYLKYLMGEKK